MRMGRRHSGPTEGVNLYVKICAIFLFVGFGMGYFVTTVQEAFRVERQERINILKMYSEIKGHLERDEIREIRRK